MNTTQYFVKYEVISTSNWSSFVLTTIFTTLWNVKVTKEHPELIKLLDSQMWRSEIYNILSINKIDV